MTGPLFTLLPFLLAFLSSFCIMILELVAGRLVAQHVGGSLIVWTSVIGIILAGICLGNVLGGRLADRIPPERAVGPLFALGSFLTIGCLWVNAAIGLTPGLEAMPWDLRTLFVVTADFLVPATVLGMISPVVAKMAVERSARSGSAIGDVYMLGAIGSIVGTFVAGFYLIYQAPTSTIVTFVAAALALLASALLGSLPARGLALLTAGFLFAGGVLTPVPSPENVAARASLPTIAVGSAAFNAVALVGHGLSAVLALVALTRLFGRSTRVEGVEGSVVVVETAGSLDPADQPRSLADLASLSFLISLAFMALEMVAGRLVTRHTGSSVYGWTSVIGVLLGGLSLGNYLGGKVADRVHNEKQASWLFLIASVLTSFVLMAESPPTWLVRNPIGHYLRGDLARPLAGGEGAFLSQAQDMTGFPWWFRILFWTAVVFFIPSIAMGTVSPVVVKLAVERVRRSKRTGTAIGSVYAWGMVGSILGTFLTGFYLIDWLGTKGMLLALATMLALAATVLGSVWHALWAGVPLGLCVIAFMPSPWLEKQALAWGIKEERGDPKATEDGLAHVNESNYYYIKVTNTDEGDRFKRTLVLDNLIHGYYVLGHPETVEYDYEHIYALVTDRAVKSRKGSNDPTAPAGTPISTLFLGGGAYTFPRHLQHKYPGTLADVAEIDPAVTRANHIALGLNPPVSVGSPEAKGGIHTVWGDARQFVERRYQGKKKYDIIYGDAFNDFSVPWHLTTRQFNDMISGMLTDDGLFMINIIDIYMSDQTAREFAESGEEGVPSDPEEAVAYARKRGGFLGAWVETARLTFPHLYVFGTDDAGSGLRETFVVVAAKKAIDLTELGTRKTDPQFYDEPKLFAPYDESHMAQLKVRSRNILLTDDYAPVENLLAPVAASRGD